MENFIVSARKYRPVSFDTVVGQPSITNTFKNAIKNNHLAQAFLFCGPRGVGKTTCARILAKTINCEKITENMEACNECEACLSFNQGNSLNIYELDAASNNSVDDIRQLMEQVRFAPHSGQKKVYIIDEVHMLSQAAFNAFLKTLEEPPPHAIFILATTEKHKIIPTILSRCQIFDFNRIQIQDITSHLQGIAEKENITAEPDALHIIAQKADGALRDALSIFDQIVSFAGSKITYEQVITNLNVLDYDYYFGVTDAMLNNNIPATLVLFNEILNNGFDGHNFIAGQSEHFRNLLVCKDPATIQLLEVGENISQRYKEQSAQCTQDLLLTALEITGKADVQYKAAKNQRLLTEIMLMQLCSITATAKKKTSEQAAPIIPAAKTDAAPKQQQSPVPKAAPNSTAERQEAIPPELKNRSEKTGPEVHEPRENYADKPQETAAQDQNTEEKPAPDIAEPVENKASSPAPIQKKQFNTVSISLNGDDKAPVEDGQEEGISEGKLPESSFDGEQLKSTWNNYAETVKERGLLYTVFTRQAPELKDKHTIVLRLINKMERETLEDEKTDLLQYLRKKLNNYSIKLEMIIEEQKEQKKLYSNTDKYQRMTEKNPMLKVFKQKFDLDLEY